MQRLIRVVRSRYWWEEGYAPTFLATLRPLVTVRAVDRIGVDFGSIASGTGEDG